MSDIDIFFKTDLTLFFQILSSFISLFLSLSLTKLIIPLLNKYFIDLPKIRGSHYLPKPKAGGIVFLSLSILIFLLNKKFLFLLALPLGIISLIDDFMGLSTKFRLIFQTSIASFFLFLGNNSFIDSNKVFISLILCIFYLIIFVGVINTMNFMDGIDGLVCGSMLIIILTISIRYDISFLPISFSLLGFLVFNWCPAKVFMGEVGSTFLGFLYAAILLSSDTMIKFSEIFLLFFPLFADAFSCRLRMLIKGRNIFKPHKLHLYQRLHQAGLNHSTVSIIYLLATLLLALSLIIFNIYVSYSLAFILLIIGFYLEKKVAIKF
tara:strand:+ start:56331 stop:57296 length:966 start_codon:yes stop_codon:yes gene_type:complete